MNTAESKVLESAAPEREVVYAAQDEGKVAQIVEWSLPILKALSTAWFLPKKIKRVLKVLVQTIETLGFEAFAALDKQAPAADIS